MFTICGDPKDVERAKCQIEEAADHFTKIRQCRGESALLTAPQLGPNAILRYVKVPLKYVGLVVGPKGHNIKRIQSETETYIMTPARDKEPVFEIRGAPDNVAEAEKRVQMYIAMRTGGMIGEHPGDVDLKKPMLPPSIIAPQSSVPHSSLPLSTLPLSTTPHSSTPHSTLPHSTLPYSTLPNVSSAWGKPEPNMFQSFSEKYDVPSKAGPSFDVTKIDLDSGYTSPSFESMREWQALKVFVEQIHQTARTSPLSADINPRPNQPIPSHQWF